MRVTLHMHGNLRRFLPDGAAETVLDVASGSTIEDVLTGLGADRDTWLVAVNGAAAERDRVLRPDDLLDCFEPVAGGAPHADPHPGPLPAGEGARSNGILDRKDSTR